MKKCNHKLSRRFGFRKFSLVSINHCIQHAFSVQMHIKRRAWF